MATLILVLLLASAQDGLPRYDAHSASASSSDLLVGGDRAWAPATAIVYGPEPWQVRFRALHDASGLWLRWDVDDHAPWHTLTRRDDPIWNEEVVEIFFDPDGDGRDYVEIEISPAGVETDLLVARGAPDLDADLEWNVQGLRSRVVHHETGWSAMVHVPWNGLVDVPGAAHPPVVGDVWRFNVFRIKRPHGPDDPEQEAVYAAWSPVPAASFHVPEVFGWMRFLP